jgi:hypothetical protein
MYSTFSTAAARVGNPNLRTMGLEEIGVDQGRDMTGFDRMRDGFFD